MEEEEIEKWKTEERKEGLGKREVKSGKREMGQGKKEEGPGKRKMGRGKRKEVMEGMMDMKKPGALKIR